MFITSINIAKNQPSFNKNILNNKSIIAESINSLLDGSYIKKLENSEDFISQIKNPESIYNKITSKLSAISYLAHSIFKPFKSISNIIENNKLKSEQIIQLSEKLKLQKKVIDAKCVEQRANIDIFRQKLKEKKYSNI